MSEQPDLFGAVEARVPPGLRYDPSLIDAAQARLLADEIAPLPFREFEFHGFTGRRRVVSFGWKYDFSAARLVKADPLPQFLLPLRTLAGRFAGIAPRELEQALVTEYPPGAAIGWHKDKAVFDEVVGISFGAPSVMRFRRPVASRWERRNIVLAPGSAYLIAGEARTEWEHSIPPVTGQRYSVTFRSMRRA